jgi:hypothetical protein
MAVENASVANTPIIPVAARWFGSARWKSLRTRITLTTLIIFVAGIWALAFYLGRTLHDDMRRLVGDQHFATASYIAAQIDQEVGARLRILDLVARSAARPMREGPDAVQALIDQRPVMLEHFNGGVLVHRLDGTVIAEGPRGSGRIGVNYIDIDTIAAALKEGRTTVGKPILGRKLQQPVIGMAVPIRDAEGRVVGALSGIVNLGKPNFLDILTDTSPLKGGYVLLVAPRHRLVVTASERRRVMEALPAPGVSALVDHYIDGFEGSDIGINALGIEVLASVKRVPAADWSVVVQLPTAEAFAPIRAMQRRTLLGAIFLTLLVGGLTGWLVRRQLAPMSAAATSLVERALSNQPPEPLPVLRKDEVGNASGPCSTANPAGSSPSKARTRDSGTGTWSRARCFLPRDGRKCSAMPTRTSATGWRNGKTASIPTTRRRRSPPCGTISTARLPGISTSTACAARTAATSGFSIAACW